MQVFLRMGSIENLYYNIVWKKYAVLIYFMYFYQIIFSKDFKAASYIGGYTMHVTHLS